MYKFGHEEFEIEIHSKSNLHVFEYVFNQSDDSNTFCYRMLVVQATVSISRNYELKNNRMSH